MDFSSLPVVKVDEISFAAVKTVKGSAFVRQYNVTKNGNPFAVVAKFSAAQGGNWYVGFANSTDGGRFNDFVAAERYVLNH